MPETGEKDIRPSWVPLKKDRSMTSILDRTAFISKAIVMTDGQTKVKPDGLDTVSSGDITGRTNW